MYAYVGFYIQYYGSYYVLDFEIGISSTSTYHFKRFTIVHALFYKEQVSLAARIRYCRNDATTCHNDEVLDCGSIVHSVVTVFGSRIVLWV